MVLILKSTSQARFISDGTPTSPMGLVSDMKLEYASKLAGLFGETGPSHGDWADLSIARYAITEWLGPGEKYLANGGYRSQDGNAETPTYLKNPDQKMKQELCARHEAINGMIKQFEALNRTFCHSRDAHQAIFNVVLNLVQANIKLEGPPFHKPYDDGCRRRR